MPSIPTLEISRLGAQKPPTRVLPIHSIKLKPAAGTIAHPLPSQPVKVKPEKELRPLPPVVGLPRGVKVFPLPEKEVSVKEPPKPPIDLLGPPITTTVKGPPPKPVGLLGPPVIASISPETTPPPSPPVVGLPRGVRVLPPPEKEVPEKELNVKEQPELTALLGPPVSVDATAFLGPPVEVPQDEKGSVRFRNPDDFFGPRLPIDFDVYLGEEQASDSGAVDLSKTLRVESLYRTTQEKISGGYILSGVVADIQA